LFFFFVPLDSGLSVRLFVLLASFLNLEGKSVALFLQDLDNIKKLAKDPNVLRVLGEFSRSRVRSLGL
jgi:hypothetical protein